jgi:hypothetical protein
MITAQAAISRFRRDLTLGAVVKALLLVAALGLVLLGPRLVSSTALTVLMTAVAGVWVALTFSSAKGSRLAALSTPLIAAGQFDEAERQLDLALRSFSLFRTAKLLGLHHLAALRHAQRRWSDAAALCRALLGQRLGHMQGLSKPTRLMLADALLELGDVHGAYEALAGLYTQRLRLSEVLTLLAVQLDYESRVGAWDRMMDQVMSKVQLAELMPTAHAAQTQALLGLAARKTGRRDWAEWLRARAELLTDVEKLVKDRPVLWELWKREPPEEAPVASAGETGPGGA